MYYLCTIFLLIFIRKLIKLCKFLFIILLWVDENSTSSNSK